MVGLVPIIEFMTLSFSLVASDQPKTTPPMRNDTMSARAERPAHQLARPTQVRSRFMPTRPEQETAVRDNNWCSFWKRNFLCSKRNEAG
jgi:hypothetical protein